VNHYTAGFALLWILMILFVGFTMRLISVGPLSGASSTHRVTACVYDM
jgi:hypothetical protein